MNMLIVTDQKQEWFEIPDATVVSARHYIGEPDDSRDASVRVLNLCRTGRYQGRGYYVSLVAEARGHRPLPEVKTVEDLKSEAFVRTLASELEPLVRETLKHDESDRFQLDVYLGRDPAQRHQPLAEQVFAKVRAPLLRVLFARADGKWRLDALHAIGVADIPTQDRAFLLEAVKAFAGEVSSPKPRRPGAGKGKPRLAILWDPKEPHKPSNEGALEKLVRTAPKVGM